MSGSPALTTVPTRPSPSGSACTCSASIPNNQSLKKQEGRKHGISSRKAEIHLPPRALAPHFQQKAPANSTSKAIQNAVPVERHSVQQGTDHTHRVVSAPFEAGGRTPGNSREVASPVATHLSTAAFPSHHQGHLTFLTTQGSGSSCPRVLSTCFHKPPFCIKDVSRILSCSSAPDLSPLNLT